MVLYSYDGNYDINCLYRCNNKGVIKVNKTKQFFKGFKEGMGDFGHNIASIINTVLLSFVYVVGVAPTSIVAKILGKHFLETKLSKSSYWSALNLKKKSIEEYYRQF